MLITSTSTFTCSSSTIETLKKPCETCPKLTIKNTRTTSTSSSIYLFKLNDRNAKKNMWNMSKVNNKNTRTTSISSEHIPHFFLMFLLSTLSKNVSWVKTIWEKKSYCETTLEPTCVPKKFTKITGKQLHWSLFLIKLQGYCKFFTRDYFSNFQWYLIQSKNPVKMDIFLY